MMKTFLIILALGILANAPTQALTFEAWIASHGLTGGDAAVDADPDKDRMDNLTEYVLAGGDPDTSGPLSILPTYGWSMALAAGNYGEMSSTPITGAPIGVHATLLYTLRAEIEEVSVAPEVTMPCPASNSDGSLFRWVSGQSVITVRSRNDGKTQGICRLRSDLLPRTFMRLNITKGTGLTLPPVDGTVSVTLALTTGGTTHVLRTVGTATTTTPTDRDISYTQVSSPTIVSDVSWPWGLGNSGLSSGDVTRSSSNLSVLAPNTGNTQLWDYVGNGSATIQIITPTRTYSRLVNTFTQSSVVSRTQSTSTTGSLRRHCDSVLDGYMSASSSINERQDAYSTYEPLTLTYLRASTYWLAAVDMTPLAAWNSNAARQKGPTLISPRHIIGAVHYPWAVNDTVHFVTAGNVTHVRTITGTLAITGTDILIGILDSDVPAEIDFAKILPSGWASKLPTLDVFGMPVIGMDQSKAGWVRNVRTISTTVICEVPNIATRLPYYKDIVPGDSGSPCFAVVGGEMVLLCTWLGGGGGSGPSIVNFTTEINAAMATLGGAYTLTAVDLSSYTTF